MPTSSFGVCLFAYARMFNQATADLSVRGCEKTRNALTDDSPHAILLPDMIRTRPERLLTTDGETTSIHQVTEELPTLRGIGQDLVTKVIVGLTSWDDRAFETFLLRDIVDLRTSGHTARETFDAGLEATLHCRICAS